MELTSLPGHELVLTGLDDLTRGVESQEELLEVTKLVEFCDARANKVVAE